MVGDVSSSLRSFKGGGGMSGFSVFVDGGSEGLGKELDGGIVLLGVGEEVAVRHGPHSISVVWPRAEQRKSHERICQA